MYKVTVFDEVGKEHLLHEPRDNEGELQLIEPVLTLEMGKNGIFVFRIAPSHPNREMILPLSSVISVYDDGELIYRGRPIKVEGDFYNISKIQCEGELAYLIDSLQRPFTFTGGVKDFFTQVVNIHNSQVDARKQFKVGIVNVADNAPDTVRSCSECQTSLRTMRQQLTDVIGGFIRVRYESDGRYLDYVSDYGGINSQPIRFGENMIDLAKYLKPADIITALIPYGAELEPEDDEEEAKRLDITSINGGKDYIFNKEAVDAYGWIWGSQTFDDVTDPEVLVAKGEAYLQEAMAIPETLELTAVDLGRVDVSVKKLNVGYWTKAISTPHNLSRNLLLSKKVLYLDNPGKDKVTLGQTRMTFTASTNKNQTEISNRIDRVAASTSKEIIRKIQNATDLITGGTGGYLVIDIYDPVTGKKKHPWRMLIMDTPDQATAKNVWQFNMNGLGFSRTGINGPYENAWTIDGNLVADFITAGTMLSERIRGGIYEVGGKGLGRDGRIVIKDAEDKVIGYWDKTGLHVLKGVIKGSEIIGAKIEGGSIEGTNIDVGIFSASDSGASIGKFIVKIDKNGVFQTEDGGTGMAADGSSGISGFLWAGVNSPLDYGLVVGLDNNVNIGKDIYFIDSWTEGDSALDMFKQLYERTNELKRRIESLEG